MKYQVWVDQGVTVAGRKYSHGSVVDSDKLAVKPNEPAPVGALKADADDEEKQRHAQFLFDREENIKSQNAAYEGLLSSGKADLAAAEKQGFIRPLITKEK